MSGYRCLRALRSHMTRPGAVPPELKDSCAMVVGTRADGSEEVETYARDAATGYVSSRATIGMYSLEAGRRRRKLSRR